MHVLIEASEPNCRRGRVGERSDIAREPRTPRCGLAGQRRCHRKCCCGVAGRKRHEGSIPSVEPTGPFKAFRCLHSWKGASGNPLSQGCHSGGKQYGRGEVHPCAIESWTSGQATGGDESRPKQERSRSAGERERLTGAVQGLVLLPARFLELCRDRLVQRGDGNGSQYGYSAAQQLTLCDPGRGRISLRAGCGCGRIRRSRGDAVAGCHLCLHGGERERKHAHRNENPFPQFHAASGIGDDAGIKSCVVWFDRSGPVTPTNSTSRVCRVQLKLTRNPGRSISARRGTRTPMVLTASS